MPASKAEGILSFSVLVYYQRLFHDRHTLLHCPQMYAIVMEHEDGCISRADRSLLLIILFRGCTHSTAEVSELSNKTMINSIDCV